MKRILFVIIGLILVNCGNKPYMSHNGREIVREHKQIAILPAQVTIPASKKIDAEAIKEEQRKQSFNYQQFLYSAFLKRKMKNKFFVEIQDVETTNTLLQKENYPTNPITKEELCRILGVDAILTLNVQHPKPIDGGVAVLTTMLTGIPSATRTPPVTTIALYDAKEKKVFWNYEVFFNATQIAKKLPYKKIN